MNNPPNALAVDQYWRLKWLLQIIAGLLGNCLGKEGKHKDPKKEKQKESRSSSNT
jgi:hypothetical protein